MAENRIFQVKIENGKIKAEVDINELVYLFHTYAENFDGNKPLAIVRKGKEEEFAKAIISWLQEPSANERDCIRWAEPIEGIFDEFLENDEKFLKYSATEKLTATELKHWHKEIGW